MVAAAIMTLSVPVAAVASTAAPRPTTTATATASAPAAIPSTSSAAPIPSWIVDPNGAGASAPGITSVTLAQAEAEVAALRTKIAAGVKAMDAARTRASTAAAEADAADAAVVTANAAADQAAAAVSKWAAQLYRNGGDVGTLGWLISMSEGNPAAVGSTRAYLDSVSNDRSADLEASARAAAAAKAAREAALQARLRADAQASAAEASATELSVLLGTATTRLDALKGATRLMGMTTAQTLIPSDTCPTSVPAGTLRGGSATMGALALCKASVAQAATPQAALAIIKAFTYLGAPYACKGIGRNDPFRFDCSSLVSRAYHEGAGLATAGATWAPSTRNIVPWDGVPLASWASYVGPSAIRPGDLALYDTGGRFYRHVVMVLANGFQLHTNSCGDVAHVSRFRGTSGNGFLVARRVLAPGQIQIPDPAPVPTATPGPVPTTPDSGDEGDPPVIVPTPTPTPSVTGAPSATGTPAPTGSGTATPVPTGTSTAPTVGPTTGPTSIPSTGTPTSGAPTPTGPASEPPMPPVGPTATPGAPAKVAPKTPMS
jgi:cell wall-associated NlpC family hydrolase